MGRWGLRELVEPRLRGLVADGLGVDAAELTPEVSLTDDLAADSLDLLELALAAEAEFGVVIPESALEDVRTFGDLVEMVSTRVPHPRPADLDLEPAPVWARVIPAAGQPGAGVERAMRLTPYVAQTIADDAARAGRGARLELEVPPGTSDDGLAAIQGRFARLGARGVEVSVRRQHPFGVQPAEVTALATASS